MPRILHCGLDYSRGGGGTTVVANPSSQPTDDLETIQIGDIVYDIQGGGSSYTETVLYNPSSPTSTSSWNSPINTSISKTDVEKYDMLVFGVGNDDHTRTFGYLLTSRLNDSSKSSVMLTVNEEGTNVKNCYIIYNPSDELCIYTTTGVATYVFDVTGIKFGGGNESNSTNYSLSEKVIGTWVDGSTLYQKTIYDSGGQSGVFTIAHGISNIENVISYSGTCIDSYGNIQTPMPLPRIGSDGNNVGIQQVSDTYISICNPTAFGTRIIDWYITLQYTKSS